MSISSRNPALRWVLGPTLLAVVLTACGPAVALPPDSASAKVVLDTYLRALVAGDCDTGRKLAAGAFLQGSGDICGHTDVKSYGIVGDPAEPSTNERVFATTLTTTGTSDGTVPSGKVTWFFTLDRQPNGSWRLIGAGSGP